MNVAGVESVFPAASVATTARACDALVRPVYVWEPLHDRIAPSNVQVNVESGSELANENDASVELVGSDGWAVMVVSGGIVSNDGVFLGGVFLDDVALRSTTNARRTVPVGTAGVVQYARFQLEPAGSGRLDVQCLHDPSEVRR